MNDTVCKNWFMRKSGKTWSMAVPW
ncbi:MAG: KxYKxGKxW signal peptide domain-containing protein [Streptococcus salivarius]